MHGRKRWAQLLEDVRRRRVDHVMIWKLDRALHCYVPSRSSPITGFSCLTRAGIDTTSVSGQLMLTILAAVAEFERGLIAERVKEGMANAKRKGTVKRTE